MQASGGWRRVVWICTGLVLLPAIVSCRKPVDAEKSELKDAGYQLNTADWLLAAGRDDVPALRKFVKAGFNAFTADDSGASALHAAARAGALKAAKFLLDHGLPVDAANTAGRTPLMTAVVANQTESVRWFLQQGADPRHKDTQGYNALTLAVHEGASGALAELAPYQRDALDSALLLAALLGRPEAIDTLTNYGASVYARMDDGRTALMLAAENGHAKVVELLLDIGASRFSTDADGKTAADLAAAAGHPEIATVINRAPRPEEFALESPADLARTMDTLADSIASKATTNATPLSNPSASPSRPATRPIHGETLSAVVIGQPSVSESRTSVNGEASAFPMPPLIMRHYREREVPLEVRSVSFDSATLAIRGSHSRELQVRVGERIPETSITVLRVVHRVQDSKLNLGQPSEVSVLEVRDESSGTVREWTSGLPANAHDPVALVEDAASGRRYTATPGQRFRSEDGTEFIVADVRPNQVVIENAASGSTQTIPLRGPRG